MKERVLYTITLKTNKIYMYVCIISYFVYDITHFRLSLKMSKKMTYRLSDKVKLIELKQHNNHSVKKQFMVPICYLEKLQKLSLKVFNNEGLDLTSRAKSV